MPQSPKTMKINFHGATPIGFVMLMYFQHFINFSPLPSRFMKLFSQIFYADSVYPRCWKNFVFINFSNIWDKTGKEFLFISWQYHGNLFVSLKTRNILCISYCHNIFTSKNSTYTRLWKCLPCFINK